MFEKINEKLDCLRKENLTHVFKKNYLLHKCFYSVNYLNKVLISYFTVQTKC